MLAASSAPLQAGPSRFHSNSVSSRTRHLHPRGGSVAGSHPIHPPSNSQGQCTQPEIQAAAPGTHHLVTAASPVSSTVSSNARLRKVVRKMLQLLMQGSHTRQVRPPWYHFTLQNDEVEWSSSAITGMACARQSIASSPLQNLIWIAIHPQDKTAAAKSLGCQRSRVGQPYGNGPGVPSASWWWLPRHPVQQGADHRLHCLVCRSVRQGASAEQRSQALRSTE